MKNIGFFIMLLLGLASMNKQALGQRNLFIKPAKAGNARINEKLQSKALGAVYYYEVATDISKESKILVNPGGRALIFVVDEVEIRGDNEYTWHGHLQSASGSIVLT